MTNEPGPQTKAVRDLLAQKPSAEILAPVKVVIDATLSDYTAARREITAYEARKTDCGCSDDSYFCRQPGCPRAEILGMFEAKPSLADLVDMFPDDEPVSQARAS